MLTESVRVGVRKSQSVRVRVMLTESVSVSRARGWY